MESQVDFSDSWEHSASEDLMPLSWNSKAITITEKEHEEPESSSQFLYERYGTNEPYSEPEKAGYHWSHETLFELMTGPSTNFYVGIQEKHFTIPKRLLYHFSDYAKLCLEGSFSEAGANAVWLRDVDPGVFQWLWQWLYAGKFKVDRYYCCSWDLSSSERLKQICQVLCRLHILGERLLFDDRFLLSGVQQELDGVIEEAKTAGESLPLAPDVVEEVLAGSAPVEYDGSMSCTNFSLRPFVLGHLCTFQVCTTVDFMEYADCFELDGAFAAEIMVFMTNEIRWAVKLWEAQVGCPVDIAEEKKRFAENRQRSEYREDQSKEPRGVWPALKILCTSAGCTTADLRAYSKLFEMDGAFTADVLRYMAAELLWIVKRWGEHTGKEVDVAAEKEEEKRIAEEECSFQHMVDSIMRCPRWTW